MEIINTRQNVWETSGSENREIIFDFEKIKKNPAFDVWISGKKYKTIIEHDFDDWNNNQEILYFENGQFSKPTLTKF